MKRNAREKHGKKTIKERRNHKIKNKNLKNQIKKMFFWKKKKTNKKIKEWKRKSGLQGVPPETAPKKKNCTICYKKSCSSWGQKMKESKTHQTHPKNKKEKQKKRTPLNPGLWRSHSTLQASLLVFNVLTVHVFFLWRKRSDSFDACVAGVTTSDGLALVKLALQVEPRRRRYGQSKNKNTWFFYFIFSCSIALLFFLLF